MTKSAFKKLSNTGTLTEGKVHDLVMYHGTTPNPWDLREFRNARVTCAFLTLPAELFGPFKLGGGQIGH